MTSHLATGELVVRLTRKCPRCPGLLVALYPDRFGRLHYMCEVCQHQEEREQPRGVQVVRWQRKEE